MNEQISNKIGPVPFQVTETDRIPSKRYYDSEFFQLENEKLWPHIWQMACRLEEIPEIGDYTQYRLLDKSVIIVRTSSGIKAFHNACRHRGVQLATGPGNCKTTGFICPFHGWRYNMDGENTYVFGRRIFGEQILEPEEIKLAPCRVETWGGCAFINFDDTAPPLIECLGPVTERLTARNVDKLKAEWWYATVLPTNWKLAMEAFMEGYHLMRTHPQLHATTFGNNDYENLGGDTSLPPRFTSRQIVERIIGFLKLNGEGMAGMVHGREIAIAESLSDLEVPDDPNAAVGAFFTKLKEEIYLQGLAEGIPVTDLNKADSEYEFKPVEFMFPHYFLLPWLSSMSSYRIRPLTEETCLFEIWSLALFPEREAPKPIVAPTFLPYDSDDFPEISRQDYANLPRQQIGLHAGKFDDMRLSKDYEGLISNYQRLIDGYIAGRDHQTLASANRIVNNGYDAPIMDIGF